MGEDLHRGHRERLRERFRAEGLDHFADHEVLELLLFYAIPRRDTNQLAHQLLERFGSLEGVFSADPVQLRQVPGMGPGAAELLHLAQALFLRRLRQEEAPRIVQNSADAYGCLRPYYLDQRDEKSFLICLDAKNKVIHANTLFEGSVNIVQISVRKVVEQALLHNAAAVILAHNHPSGVALPSAEDYQVTIQIQKALEAVNVELRDHIVLADGDYVSMADTGFFLR
ncbi:MAG: DNA repair protein RadC [Oscillospiraceae bacterium]|nr:DNA repair protein RadC [Oscillospiraceae bacterium]MBR6425030.1 DNA repair protein RadC [Oscillospiraceae bacterium]